MKKFGKVSYCGLLNCRSGELAEFRVMLKCFLKLFCNILSLLKCCTIVIAICSVG